MRRAARALVVLSLVGAAGCDLFTGPDLPSGAVRFEPPARYRVWWDMVQECSGRTGDLRRVRWYQVPGAPTLVGPDQGIVNGQWYRDGNRIVLAGTAVLQGEVVRHEMLHALVREPGHAREQFQARCGGIVDCGSACQDDGGGPPVVPTDAPRIPASALRFRMDVAGGGDFARDSGAVAVVITATNPNDHPVTAALRNGSVRMGVWGASAYVLNGRNQGSSLAFPAGWSRRWVFDLELWPGTYLLQGLFDGDEVGRTELRVAP